MASGLFIPTRCLQFTRLDLVRKAFRISIQQHQQQQQRVMSSSAAGENDSTVAPGLLKVLQQNPKRLKRIRYLGKLFECNGHEVRIAGGAVRDILRGKEPQDIDFATTARPEESLEILSKHEDLMRIYVTAAGQRHGTVAVKFKEGDLDLKRIKLSHPEDGEDSSKKDETQEQRTTDEPEYDEEPAYEITTLRCDKFTDGRHAEVEFIKDWRQDAERRDLTMNAMFLTLNDGKLIDYFDGESDLKNGIVRFVGDADLRIKEDYLRILRFFRFWSRYSQGKQPDEQTLANIRNNLDGLNRISGERIWQEIKKTMSHLPCYDVMKSMLEIRLFDYAGLLDKNLTDYEEYCRNVLDDLKILQDNVFRYISTTLNQKLADNPSDNDLKRLKDLFPVLMFATTIQTEELCLNAYTRLKFSNLERDTILYIIENRKKKTSMKAFKFQLALSPAPERPQVLQRIRAFCILKGEFDYIDELSSWQVPQFPVSGNLVAKEIKKRKLNGNKIKIIIEALKFEWANSDYKLTVDELTDLIPKKIDELVENES